MVFSLAYCFIAFNTLLTSASCASCALYSSKSSDTTKNVVPPKQGSKPNTNVSVSGEKREVSKAKNVDTANVESKKSPPKKATFTFTQDYPFGVEVTATKPKQEQGKVTAPASQAGKSGTMPPSQGMPSKPSGLDARRAVSSNPLSDLSKAVPRPSANQRSTNSSLPGNVFVAPPNQPAVKQTATPPPLTSKGSTPSPSPLKGSNETPVPPVSMKAPSSFNQPSLKSSSSGPGRHTPSPSVGNVSTNPGAGVSSPVSNTANTFASSSTPSTYSAASASVPKPPSYTSHSQDLLKTKSPVLTSAKESSSSSKKSSTDKKPSGGGGSGCLL